MNSPIIKHCPADFYVEERLHFPLDGSGEHLWLYIEKSGMNTAFVKRQLGKLSGCPSKDIGHSGLKDRHAITRQWFSLPAAYGEQLPNEAVEKNEYWRIIERQRHGRKLRIGSHRHNFFRIVVRQIAAAPAAVEAALAQIATQGFANYFGDQRFGSSNLSAAQAWVAKGKLPKAHEERSRVLSTLRAALFNAQLDARIAQGNWTQLLSGDRAMLSGSHSHFVVETQDDDLAARLASGDISPAAWLVGKNEQLSGEAGAIAQQALAVWQAEQAYLRQYCDSDWRALRVIPQDFTWQWQGADVLELCFILPRGAFATALLQQIFPDLSECAHERD